jgi:hypothetical protein
MIMKYNVQIDNLVRPATEEETIALDAAALKREAELQAVADKIIAKAALLERLGITDEEAQLLLV